MMKADDLRAMTVDPARRRGPELKKEQFNLRFQRATGQLENTSRVRVVRRDIAPHQKRLRSRSAPRNRSRSKEAEVPKRTLQGIVVSDKQAKTRVVRVERRYTHPPPQEDRAPVEEIHAHDENNEYSVGDVVWIEEHRPISKLKRWTVVQGEKKKKVT